MTAPRTRSALLALAALALAAACGTTVPGAGNAASGEGLGPATTQGGSATTGSQALPGAAAAAAAPAARRAGRQAPARS